MNLGHNQTYAGGYSLLGVAPSPGLVVTSQMELELFCINTLSKATINFVVWVSYLFIFRKFKVFLIFRIISSSKKYKKILTQFMIWMFFILLHIYIETSNLGYRYELL